MTLLLPRFMARPSIGQRCLWCQPFLKPLDIGALREPSALMVYAIGMPFGNWKVTLLSAMVYVVSTSLPMRVLVLTLPSAVNTRKLLPSLAW